MSSNNSSISSPRTGHSSGTSTPTPSAAANLALAALHKKHKNVTTSSDRASDKVVYSTTNEVKPNFNRTTTDGTGTAAYISKATGVPMPGTTLATSAKPNTNATITGAVKKWGAHSGGNHAGGGGHANAGNRSNAPVAAALAVTGAVVLATQSGSSAAKNDKDKPKKDKHRKKKHGKS